MTVPNRDPLEEAITELDADDLDRLLTWAKFATLDAEAEGSPRLSHFFLCVYAHLQVEQQRRAQVLAELSLDLADTTTTGALIDDLAAELEAGRRQLRGDTDRKSAPAT